MPKGSGGEPSWWSSGSVPDDLPSWARRSLDEAPEDLAPSPPPPPPARHRRHAAAADAGGAHRLRGWGLAAASVAAAVAVVPLAVSTLANNGANTALPRVGTFPVVAPGTLPGGALPPGSVTRRPQEPSPPADASVLPPLEDPTVTLAEPPRTVTVAPRVLARDAEDGTTTPTTPSASSLSSSPSSPVADGEDEEGGTPSGGEGRTPRDAGGGQGGSTSGGSASGGSASGGSTSGGSTSGGSTSGGSTSGGSTSGGSTSGGSTGGGVVGGVGNAVGGVLDGAGRTAGSLLG